MTCCSSTAPAYSTTARRSSNPINGKESIAISQSPIRIFLQGYADYITPEYMFSCKMPEDGQDILIATSWGVSQDMCMRESDEAGNNLFVLDEHGDWDGVKAWAAMPQYKGGDGDA